MKFLLNLVVASGLISPAVATSHEELGSRLPGMDSVSVESGEGKEGGTDLNPFGSLTANTIRNPYADASDQPFTIASNPARTAAPMATKVACGGRTWEQGQYLGRTGDGKSVNVQVTEDRIYLNWAGQIADNIFILLHLQENTFPNNTENDALIKLCVNPMDPSTAPQTLLGRQGDKITCKGYVMENGEKLGTFRDQGRETYQFTKYVNGRLRVMIKQGPDDTRETNYNMSLMRETLEGRNGSDIEPKWRGILNMEMINGCYWPDEPKSATPVVENNCASGPVVTGTSNITQTSLRFTYTASGVSSIRWRVRQNGGEIRNGSQSVSGGAANISYGQLSPGIYTLEIEGANCTSSPSSRSFTVPEPVVNDPNCQNGPSISALRNVSPSSVTVDFGGNNLRDFSWRILQGNYAVASGRTGILTSGSTSLSFNYLQNGNYTFELKPEDCKSTSVATRTFAVSGTDTRSNCDRGPSLRSLINSGDISTEFLFDGENVFAIDWKIVNSQGIPVRQNRVAPQNNHPIVTYGKLDNGTYRLQIQGGNCKSAVSSAPFSIGPLPIYVANFKGEVVEEGVKLSWEVVAEQDGKEFEVLRYDDKMKNEEVLGKVSLTDARTGWYNFTDRNPLQGINYYRLKQIDVDGSFTHSKLVSVNPGVIRSAVTAPNPAQEYVDVQFTSRTSGISKVIVYNLTGVPVSVSDITINEGKNVHRVNVKKFTAGTYIIKITHAGEVSKMRFAKVD